MFLAAPSIPHKAASSYVGDTLTFMHSLKIPRRKPPSRYPSSFPREGVARKDLGGKKEIIDMTVELVDLT